MMRNASRSLLALGVAGAILTGSAGTSMADGICEIFTDKTARPSNVLVGQEVQITLTLDSRCPQVPGTGQADIVLSIDRSASQVDNGTWDSTIQAARSFVEEIDFPVPLVGAMEVLPSPYADRRTNDQCQG